MYKRANFEKVKAIRFIMRESKMPVKDEDGKILDMKKVQLKFLILWIRDYLCRNLQDM